MISEENGSATTTYVLLIADEHVAALVFCEKFQIIKVHNSII